MASKVVVYAFSHLVGPCDKAVVAVEDAEGQVVGVPAHESHEEAVVSHVVRPHDHQVEQIPHLAQKGTRRSMYVLRASMHHQGGRGAGSSNLAVPHILDDQFPDQIVRVVAVPVQEGGQQTQELAFLERGRKACGGIS